MKNNIKNIFVKNIARGKIINREELVKRINSNGLLGIEIENNSKEDNRSQIFMKSKNIDDIFKFAKENNIHTIFFEYYYYNKEYFKIDLEELEEKYLDEILNIMKNDVIEYNNKVNKINFETPAMLTVYCIYNGCLITVRLENEWGEIYKKEIISGVQQMEILFEKHQKRLEEYIQEKEEQRELELEKLKRIIFNDEKFQKSTNKDLRTTYIRDFLKKNPNYKDLFNYGNGYDWNSYKWIDKIWKEYKEKNK